MLLFYARSSVSKLFKTFVVNNNNNNYNKLIFNCINYERRNFYVAAFCIVHHICIRKINMCLIILAAGIFVFNP